MAMPRKELEEEYAAVYSGFDSPLIKKVRSEAFEEDIGQHSWVTADELRDYLHWLKLASSDHFLDFGCGPAGPLTYIAKHTQARATGIDINAVALESAQRRVAQMGLDEQVCLQRMNEDQAVPYGSNIFDAVVSIDVVMHLPDRSRIFAELCRVIVPSGCFLFTDACIVNGPLSDEDIRIRSHYGMSHFVPDGFNEATLNAAGFELVKKEVRTQGLVAICRGRHKTREKYKKELICDFGAEAFEHEQCYLKKLVDLYSNQTLLRYVYLARKT